MADKKISALTPSTTPLTGAEVLPIVQSGSTVKVSVADLTAGRAVAATSVTTGLGAVGTPAYTFTGDTDTGIYSPAEGITAFSQNGAESVRIVSSGNVGIGTSSPIAKLHIDDQNNAGFRLNQYNDGEGSLLRMASARGTIASPTALLTDSVVFAVRGFGYTSAGTFGSAVAQINARAAENFTATAQGTYLTFITTPIGSTTAAERMRINASGNVGIGTSSPVSTLDVVGQEIRIQAPTFPKFIWNASTNGTNLKKWQAYVDNGGTFKIAALNDAENAELGTYLLDRTFFAFGVDNTASVGTASVRWSVIYAATGTINTSDEREKEWRGGLTEGELRASKRIVAELGFYRWVDAIAKKGDDARYHFGARAQQVWAIMADEGLVAPIIDGLPGNTPYAFLCFDQWDEVPEVPAVEEVLGEDGEVVVDARAAIPAKPAGNRFGLRVDQLTMFLIAAQEQRLAALEALL